MRLPARPAPAAFLALSVLAGASALPAPAHASPSYSTVLERTLALPCRPSCLLCHTSEKGGFATANTKLGITLRQKYDAECCKDDALVSIVQALEAAHIDSDGDGTPDVQELRDGTDPNAPDPAALWTCEPDSDDGCSASGRAPHDGAWMALVALALCVLPRRTRRVR